MDNDHWIPEIMYEDSQEGGIGLTSHIPFIPVPSTEEMPSLLYIFESRETGEIEPGPAGEDLSVTEMELHQYADMEVLKKNLDLETYDAVRKALTLEPMHEAVSKGRDITDNIRKNMADTIDVNDGVYTDDSPKKIPITMRYVVKD